jgi:hypothetical protein
MGLFYLKDKKIGVTRQIKEFQTTFPMGVHCDARKTNLMV